MAGEYAGRACKTGRGEYFPAGMCCVEVPNVLCGAHLDPGEQCDCGAPGGSEQAAKQDTQQAGQPAP